MKPSSHPERREYEIMIKGHLDERWSHWFEGLTITTGLGQDGTPTTTFSGPIVDQANLHGVLAKIRDMNLPLISVKPVEPSPEDESQTNYSQEALMPSDAKQIKLVPANHQSQKGERK